MSSFTVIGLTVTGGQTTPTITDKSELYDVVNAFIRMPIVDRIIIRKDYVGKP